MERREFLANTAGAAIPLAGLSALNANPFDRVSSSASKRSETNSRPFALDYAPHFGMFKHGAGDDLVAQLEFMNNHGFRSMEDNGMRSRSVTDQNRIATTMTRLGMRMGIFVLNPETAWGVSFAEGKDDFRDSFLADVDASIEVAKRVNAKWMTVVLGQVAPRIEPEYQTANAVEILRRAAERLEKHNLVMVLEPLNRRDHPAMLLARVPHAYQICRAVNSPACKILFDIYHQQITEGNLIPNFDAAWNEIGYVQVGDNPGRNEPTTGEINFRNVFGHLHARGYSGVVGMEHGNSKPGAEGELAVINTYSSIDPEM